MKHTIFIPILCIVFSFSLFAQQNNEHYYYYQGEKIFLKQSTNKIFLKFAQNADKEQISSLINSNRSFQLDAETNASSDVSDFAVLKTKNDKEVLSSVAMEAFKSNSAIISATPLFLYHESLQGLTDEFVVKLKSTTPYSELKKLAKQNQCRIVKENQFVKNQFMISVSKDAELNSMEMSRLFFETELFEFSEPNFIVLNAFYSNDTYFNQQWALENTGQNGWTYDVDIKAEQAWTISTGANIQVAVLDDGVDLTHPDLQANLLPGYDASGNNSGGATVFSVDNHGTACAGIIGAIKDNGKGIAGVAPDCKMRSARIITTTKYGIDYNWAATAIEWALRNGVDVISNSWGGGPPYSPLTNAINVAASQGRNGKGCVVVFATGNHNLSWVNYPANLSNIITVGAMSPCGQRKSPNSCDGDMGWGSNYGPEIDVVAPGVFIPTTTWNGGYTQTFNGTSSATPHVAGIAALILSVNPDLTQKQVRDIIEQTAQKVGDYTYADSATYPTALTWRNGLWISQRQ